MKVILTEEQLKQVISEEIAGNQAMVNPLRQTSKPQQTQEV